MQTVGRITVGNQQHVVLVRDNPRRMQRFLKLAKDRAVKPDLPLFTDEGLFLEDSPSAYRDLLSGQTIRL